MLSWVEVKENQTFGFDRTNALGWKENVGGCIP